MGRSDSQTDGNKAQTRPPSGTAEAVLPFEKDPPQSPTTPDGRSGTHGSPTMAVPNRAVVVSGVVGRPMSDVVTQHEPHENGQNRCPATWGRGFDHHLHIDDPDDRAFQVSFWDNRRPVKAIP